MKTTLPTPPSGIESTPSLRPPAEIAFRPPQPRGPFPKLGLIGCGGITQHHLEACRRIGAEVVAFCDLDLDRARARRDAFYPQAAVTALAHEVLSRDDVGLVDIATHPEHRVPLIEAALSAGKHVLSQKPFVLDLDRGERLVALAKERGVCLAVNQNGRWAPHFCWIRNAIRAGLLGEVSTVDCTVQWNHNWTAGTPFDGIRHLLMLDFAIHWFDQVRTYFAPRTARSVACTIQRSSGQRSKPPLLGHALIEYEAGQATLSFNGDSVIASLDETHVVGSRGVVRSTGPDLNTQNVCFTDGTGPFAPALEGAWFPAGFLGTLGELLCAIEEGREPEHSGQDNLASLELCFAALASADAGGVPVAVGSVRGLQSVAQA